MQAYLLWQSKIKWYGNSITTIMCRIYTLQAIELHK